MCSVSSGDNSVIVSGVHLAVAEITIDAPEPNSLDTECHRKHHNNITVGRNTLK
jgi:hypothetical protein